MRLSRVVSGDVLLTTPPLLMYEASMVLEGNV
jgi:hypothetical protein